MQTHEAFDRIKELLGSLQGIGYKALRRNTNPDRRREAAARLKQLKARAKKVADAISSVEDEARGYKYRVYKKDGGWMSVEIAKGDTWEEGVAAIATALERDPSLRDRPALALGGAVALSEKGGQ